MDRYVGLYRTREEAALAAVADIVENELGGEGNVILHEDDDSGREHVYEAGKCWCHPEVIPVRNDQGAA